MINVNKKSWRIVLMFAAAAFFLTWIGNPIVSNTSDTSVQSILHSYETSPAIASDMIVRETGTIAILFGDTEAGDNSITETYFTNDDGEMMQVNTIQPTELLAYHGDEVTVEYAMDEPTLQDDFALPTITISNITVAQNDDLNAAVTGNTQWVNVACRFGDMTDETPRELEYFESMMVNDAPGMDDYWRETSAQIVNIEGSGAYGWYNLPKTKAQYLRMAAANTGNALRQLMNDCVNAAQAADGVDFAQYGGINMMLNDTFGCCAWGGRMTLRIDGRNMSYRTTWLPPWAFNSLHVIAHEMGHGWGLPHSSGPYGRVYDSAWDVMSGGNSNHTDAICRIGSDPLGCWQVGTISFHLAMLGWIPDDRIVIAEKGTTTIVELEPLTTLGDNDDNMAIFVPTRGNQFYTVELRAFIDYDRNLPGEAVILHEVVPGRSSPALVVDADNNGNPNDEGAMWHVGETFSGANIEVEVVSQEGTTVTVRVTNNN